MTILLNTQEDTGPYVSDPEETQTIERLLRQDQVTTNAIGELFPAHFTPSAGQVVLDVACGPGGWALDAAHAQPLMEVIGLDRAQMMIRFARSQARARDLSNVGFQKVERFTALEFPEDAFDLVNARFLSTFLDKNDWSPLLHECFRIMRVGGMMCLTDGEWIFSNGEASEHYASLLRRALWLQKQSFGPQGGMHGITLMLSHFLRQARFSDIRHHAYAVEYSYGTEAHTLWYQSTVRAFPRVASWLVAMGLTTQEEFQHLCDRMAQEMQQPGFHAMLFFLRVCGTKPEGP